MAVVAEVRRVLGQPGEVAPALRGLIGVARRATSCASPPRVRGRLHLRNQGQLHLGRAVTVEGFPLPTKITVRPGAELHLGTGCFLNYGVDVVATCRVVLGEGVLVGPLVSIVDDDMHETEPGRGRRRAPITIGDDVWLGRGVVVLPGTTIGAHTVVAAGAVVRGDIPAKVLVGGVPAKVLRPLDVPDDWRRS
jgi:acetyltransferase-like isoleucine patch superfamily enzyme